MKLYSKEFANQVGCSINTLQIYICRSEFSHIKRCKDNKHFVFYDNIKKLDIDKISKMLKNNKK